MELFEGNDVEGSVAAFDEAAKDPSIARRLWQRGLSLYYVDDFENAAAQFELDVAENPNDTEESIWHFLSVARAKGIDEARQRFITVGLDPRPTMRVVYDMFQNGDTASVERLTTTSPAASFYASLYRGLYAEALGDTAGARKWILNAVDNPTYATSGDYMYALASVHAQRRGFRRSSSDL